MVLKSTNERTAPADGADTGAVFTYDSPLLRRAARSAPRVRLVCFPHAGAASAAFAAWPGLLPSDVEVVTVTLPGREDRTHEPPATRTGPLVRSVVAALRPYLTVPVAFFGHSGGALFAFEVARAMRRRLHTEPIHLFVSGQRAPGLDPAPHWHGLDDDEFDRRIRELGGFGPELLDDDAARAFVLHAVRADFALWENHEHDAAEPLGVPVTAFSGTEDPRADADGVGGWEAHTHGAFRLCVLPGGHFFVDHERVALLAEIRRDLGEP